MNRASPCCVHVVDDDEMARETVSSMLACCGFFVRTYDSAAAFIAEMPTAAGGCVLADIRMPDMSGIALADHIKRTSDRFCVVVMSGCTDIPPIIDAIQAGAVDFLEKPFSLALLEAKVTSVFERLEANIPPPCSAYESDCCNGVFATLTPREREVLRGMLDGKLNKTVAHDLGISVRTVEGYRSRIISKTQTHSFSELVRTAVLAGL